MLLLSYNTSFVVFDFIDGGFLMLRKILTIAAVAALAFSAAAFLPAADKADSSTVISASAADSDFELGFANSKYAVIMGYNGKASTVTIPESIGGCEIMGIEASAFSGCETVKKIVIPKTVTFIRDQAIIVNYFNETEYRFYSRNPEISVASDNKYFTSSNGILYDKNKTKLILYPTAKTDSTFTVPSTVTSIEKYAFSGNKNIKTVILPEGLKSINCAAFYNCSNIKKMAVPSSVTYIATSYTEGGIGSNAIGCEDEQNPSPYGSSGCDLPVDGFIMYGTKGSTAESYAKNCGLTFATRKTISSYKVTIPYASYTYRGRGIKPTVTVKDSSGKKLTKGTDYTVSYKNNTNVGTATITVTGINAYSGTLTKKFTVKPLDLTSSYAKVTIPYSSYTYTGSAIKPAVTVKFKDGDVIPTGQYTVSYSANKNVGTAAITVKGNGKNTTGTFKKTFVVKPAKNEIKTITSTKGAFKITWNKGTAGTVGYQVQYSTDKNFSKNVHSWTTTTLSKTSENFSSVPKSGETWYVKVRSFYTKDGKSTSTRYGNYSAVKTIKIK